MRHEIRIVGSGGQGVILSGILLTHALGIYEGKEVAQTQSYGPESRGGACRADIVISDKKIDYMKVETPDYLLAFNEVGFVKYKDQLADDPYILVDSTFVDSSTGYAIQGTKLAEDELKGFVANLVMLGAFAKTSDIVSYESLENAIKDVLAPSFHQLNIQALKLGYDRVGE